MNNSLLGMRLSLYLDQKSFWGLFKKMIDRETFAVTFEIAVIGTYQILYGKVKRHFLTKNTKLISRKNS